MSITGVVLNCRTCTRACKDYKSLFDENVIHGENTTLADLLQYCTDLSFNNEVSETMPTHMCTNCIRMLEQAFTFKRMVIESDELLRQGLQENNDYIMLEMLSEVEEEELERANEPGVKFKSADIEQHVEALSEVDVEYVEQVEMEADEIGEMQLVSNEVDSQVSVEYVHIKDEIGEYMPDFQSIDDDENVIVDHDEQDSIVTTESNAIEPNIDDVVEEVDEEVGEEQDIEDHLDQQEINIDDNIVESENGDRDESENAEADIDGDGTEEGDGDAETVIEEGEFNIMEPKKFDGKGHVCEVCGKGFRQLCRLRQHLQTHNTEKLYVCDVCGKKMKHLRNYKEHIITHTDLKPHQCDICNRFYRTTSSLAAHKRSHAEEKPYKCDMCGRGFAAFDHMRRHKLTHTGERPYACNLCDKAYYDSSSLRTHMTSHTGVKAFTCEICGIGLTQKSGYKKHMLVHSGVKPHKCPICGRCFTFTSNLNAHVLLHSGEKPFKCEKCPKCFPTKKRLVSHQRVHNKETVVSPMDQMTPNERREALIKGGQKMQSTMPDLPDQSVSRSKVVVVL